MYGPREGRLHRYTTPFMITPDRKTFRQLAGRGNAIALVRRLMSDQLTPVLGYRRLVSADERTAPTLYGPQ